MTVEVSPSVVQPRSNVEQRRMAVWSAVTHRYVGMLRCCHVECALEVHT